MTGAESACHPEPVEGQRTERTDASSRSCFDKLSMTKKRRRGSLLVILSLSKDEAPNAPMLQAAHASTSSA
jgi:hypothetical protein